MLALTTWVVAALAAAPGNDGVIFWDGLHHDPTRALYRPDLERVNAADGVMVRLRSYQFDLSAVSLEYFDGSWRSVPARFESDLADCDNAGLPFPCVMWTAAIPPGASATHYRFRTEDGADVDYLGAGTTTPAQVYEDAPETAQSFALGPVATGKRIHLRASGTTQTLEVADAPCGIPGAFMNVSLSAAVDGWRTAIIPGGTPGSRLAFRVTTDGTTRTTDRLGRPWTSTFDEAWLDAGLTHDVHPASVLRRLVDAHTHPISNAQEGAYAPDQLTTVLDTHGVALGLTMDQGREAEVEALVETRPDRYRGLTWAFPTADATARAADLARVENDLATRGFVGIKFHPVLGSFPADAAFMDAYLQLAARYRVPVVIHTQEQSGATPVDAASPRRIVDLALRHPGVVVIMFHMDIAVCDRTPVLEEALRAPNVLVETSWSNARQVRQALCRLGAHRVVFGTDATTDGAGHYEANAIQTAACDGTYESYNAVIAQVRGAAPFAALGAEELASWERDSAIGAFELSLRPFPPANRPACATPPPPITASTFPYPQHACVDFPVLDAGQPPVDSGIPDAAQALDAALPMDAAVTPTDAAMSIPDAAVAMADAAMSIPDAAVAMPDAATTIADAAMSLPDASTTIPDAAAPTDASSNRPDGRLTCTPGCRSATERVLCNQDNEARVIPCSAGTQCVDNACVAVDASVEPPPRQVCSCAVTAERGAPGVLLLGLLLIFRRRRSM